MSTSFEIMAAAQSGMKVLGLSLITNKCLAPGDHFPEPTHAEVLEATAGAGRSVMELVRLFIERLDTAAYPPSFAASAFMHVVPNAAAGRKPAAAAAAAGASAAPCCDGHSVAHAACIVGGAALVGALAALAAVRLFKLKL